MKKITKYKTSVWWGKPIEVVKVERDLNDASAKLEKMQALTIEDAHDH